MHELGYTKNVIETVVQAAENANAKEVKAVYVTIGELRDIVDDLFQMCFKHFAEGTVAANAEVNIERIPFMVRCNKCGAPYHIDIHKEDTCDCPLCHERDYKMATGMEFFISKIEVV